VAQYIKQVNHLETGLTPSLQQLTLIGSRFAKNQGVAGGSIGTLLHGGTVDTAVARILTVRKRIAALPTPAPATHLRVLLLRLIDKQVALARQLGRMMSFLPRFDSALKPLTPAMTTLENSLRQSSAYGYSAVLAVYAQKAGALRRFQGVVDRVIVRLRPLKPPAAFRPDYKAQLASLKGMSSSAGRLATALVGGAPGNVQPLLTAFDKAALSAQSTRVQHAHIAAVRRYDRSVASLTTLSGEAERERLRLANNLT
jgi:hypothetical protein